MDKDTATERLRLLTDEMIAVLIQLRDGNDLMSVRATIILQYDGERVSRMGMIDVLPTPAFVTKLENEANGEAEGE